MQALAARHSGHRICLQNGRFRVRITPGCQVFMSVFNAVLLSKSNMHRHCAYLKQIKSSKTFKKILFSMQYPLDDILVFEQTGFRRCSADACKECQSRLQVKDARRRST
jgi:hypothetical protein